MKTKTGSSTDKTNSPIRKLLALLVLVLLSGAASQAAIFYWDGNGVGGTNSTSGSDANIVSAAVSPTNYNNNGNTVLLTTTSASNNTGASGSTNYGAACKIGALSTATSTYFELTVTPTGSAAVTLTSMNLGSRGTSTGPQLISVFSSIDGYATAIGSVVVVNNSTWASNSITFSGAFLTGATGTPVTLRIYGSNGTGSPGANTANWRIDDIRLTLSTGGGGGPIPPSITQNPPAQTTNWPGSTASFLVAATGDATLSYRWQSNLVDLADGGQISGSGTSNLVLTAVDSSLETSYRVIVTNDSGSATSSVANLVIATAAPTITSDPLSRSGILGSVGTFQVAATVQPITGAPATIYQWQSNSVDIVDGGRFSGAATPKLTITGLVADDAGTYSCIVSNEAGGGSSLGATLTVGDTGTLAFWNFNIATNPATPEVYYGVASAELAGITNGFFATADDGNDPGNPTKYWGTSQYPSNPVNPATNKTTGVRFNVDTTGLRNIMFTLSTRLTTTASRYSRLQYTTDGTTFIDYPGSSTYTGGGSTWDSTGSTPATAGRIFDLSAFPGVRNNPNFGVRVVTETENTATYGASPTTNYVGLSAGYSPNGTVSYDLVDFEASVTNANDVPTVDTITSFGMLDTGSPTNISFAIGDTETAAASLTVTASSFNQTVMPNANLSVSAGGSPRTLTVTPVNGVTGMAPVMVTVADADGNSIATIFEVTVLPGNFAPTVTGLVNTNTFTNTPVSQTFTIADDGGVGSLTVSTFSGNTTLVPNVNTTVTGSGATRTNTVTGLDGLNGIAPISVVVTDTGSPAKSATNSYGVIIRSSTNILAVDSFDYDTAGSLKTNSAFIWQTHSGTAGQVGVGGGVATLASPANDSEDVNFPLFGAPWNTNSGAVLYTSFKAKWLSLPGAIGTYMAHFMDTNTGVGTGFGARIWASTNTASVGDAFRLSINNGNGATNVNAPFPLDLVTNVDYTVVTRFVLSNGVATMWINPTSEGSTSVTATDVPTTNAVINPINVVAYAFRQSTTDGGYGTVAVDDLKVGLSFFDATGIPSPVQLNITTSGTDAILSWTDPTGLFKLASGTNVTLITNVISGATSPYTNLISGSETYFRLVYP